MNSIVRKLLIALTIIGSGTNLMQAYEFDFMNSTDLFLVVKLNVRNPVHNEDYYQLIPPRGSTKFALKDGYCFLRASWDEWKKKSYWGDIPYKGGFDLVTNQKEAMGETNLVVGRIQGDITVNGQTINKQRYFGDKIAPSYSFSPMGVVMTPNDVFKKTVQAAGQLLGGLDQLACQTIEVAKDFIGITASNNVTSTKFDSNIVGSISETPISNPTKTMSTIDLLSKLKTLFINQKTAIAAKQYDKITNNKSSIESLTNDHMAELTKLFSARELAAIKQGWSNTFNTDAIEFVNKKLSSLETSTNIDTQYSIVKTHMVADFEKYLPKTYEEETSAPLKGASDEAKEAAKSCSFGLGQIGAAAGKIAGLDMCKHRQFIIAYVPKKGNPDEMEFEPFSSKPKLQLITGYGE